MLAVLTALREWRHYLLGSEFELYTDHNSLQYFHTMRDLSPKMQRWLEIISDFHFQIRYHKGSANVVADALSRQHILYAALVVDTSSAPGIPAGPTAPQATLAPADPIARQALLAAISTTVVEPGLLAEFRAVYRTDPLAKDIRGKLRAGQPCEFTERDGLYYHTSAGSAPALYVPTRRELRSRLLAEFHDSAAAGHLGRDKTLACLQGKFWWPGLAAMVDAYIRSCSSCQLNKPRNHAAHGLLQPIPPALEPWAQVSLDFITCLLPTPDGHDAALVMVCTATKMARFAPCSSTVDAPGAARLFHSYVASLFGVPSKLISDRDPRFASCFWQTVWRLHGTKLALSPAFHPQTDLKAGTRPPSWRDGTRELGRAILPS
eukprot:scaffold18.g1998.t1